MPVLQPAGTSEGGLMRQPHIWIIESRIPGKTAHPSMHRWGLFTSQTYSTRKEARKWADRERAADETLDLDTIYEYRVAKYVRTGSR